jgi:hypothetical protein
VFLQRKSGQQKKEFKGMNIAKHENSRADGLIGQVLRRVMLDLSHKMPRACHSPSLSQL